MRFLADSKEYSLDKEHFGDFLNDEENPIKDIDEDYILEILKGKKLDFEKAYYNYSCVNCKSEKQGKSKAYEFYEYHFYLYTKDGVVVSNSFQTEEGESYARLEKVGKVNNSYIVSIIICAECGYFEIEIEEFEV
ncbi:MULTISPECIES: DUF3785 family protein [Clostridium]|uniref:DUF3785 family protein n=1 Tax=Clostridium cibarium TaxID=2762247 RepID=A0ABR8PU33_9CLOT|nr:MULTISPECIES: DUF3785 family protein [Clostridium]MBD7911671.1 DUF3785 family protein [Clostridium cibarium]